MSETLPEWDVIAAAELADGVAREFAVGDEVWPIKGFVLRSNDRLFAWLNRCPHAGHALNLDLDDFYTPDGDYLRCMSHGALFEPDTGLCVAGPCLNKTLTSLMCREEGGRVLVRAPASMRDIDTLL